MDSDSDSSSNNEEPISKRKINFPTTRTPRARRAHGAHGRMGAWAQGGRMAHGRSRGARVAEVREEGSWLWYARRARGRDARGGRGAEGREAGAGQGCAKRARG